MERWSNRVAMVTGASAGIGAAIAKELVLKGMRVVAMARRVDRVEALNEELRGASGKLYPLKCDVTIESDILDAFEWTSRNLGGVDVLVNNAGVTAANSNLTNSSTENWETILDVNVLALSICTREAIKSMRSRGVDDGHIIHISSVGAHSIINLPNFGMYSASKFAVRALTEALRKELIKMKSRIKVSSISPGVVKTELMMAAGMATNQERYESFPHLEVQDIADSVVFALAVPERVQIIELTLRPVGETI